VASPPGRKPYGLEAATITRVIAVKPSTSSDEANRSRNSKTTELKLQGFFLD
jgi:hypothetical protein